MNDHDDSDLRSLFDDAVSGVHPRGGTGEIRARARRPSAARWLPLTVAAALATVVVIGGIAWLADRQQDRPTAAPSPHATATPTAPSVPTKVPVYFVGDTAAGPRLFKEVQVQQTCGVDGCLLRAAASSAVSGTPTDPDYRVPWPDGTRLETATYDGKVLTIGLTGTRLHDRPAQMSQQEAEMAVQQLIWTAQAGLGLDQPPVRILLDGQPSDQVLGVATSEPLAVASPDQSLAAVSIESPAQGASVASGFTVTGQAATFEANVVWELKQGDRTVRTGFTTAAECCTLSPYSFTVQAPPGDYTLVVHDTDESGGEGVGVTEDTKDLTVG